MMISMVSYGDMLLQVNEVLETSLGQLQARNNPHAEAVAAALNRTGSTERPGSSLMLPTSPLRARAAETAGASQGAHKHCTSLSFYYYLKTYDFIANCLYCIHPWTTGN